MFSQLTLLASTPFFSASTGNTLAAAPPAGEPSLRPSTSLSVLMGLPALVMSAKGVRL